MNTKGGHSMSEILAPAGSYEALEAAVKGGCDAVYLGGSRFSARSYATNFDLETLTKGIEYAHLSGVSVYYALNTMIKENEMSKAIEDLDEAYMAGIDAVIIQDLGLASIIKSRYPGLEIHGSTQLSVHSVEGAQFMASQGFNRIVLGRELSLDEIKQIKESCQIELEVFIHGALCYAYSGKCLMSSYIGGRSGNRGSCAQTCRLPFKVSSGGRTSDKQYFLSPKDIMSIGLLPMLIEAGVDSLKIEGRMKSPYYVAKVVSLYRKYHGMALTKEPFEIEEQDLEELMQLFNRGGFTEGYLKPSKESMISQSKPNHQGLIIGKVLGYDKKSRTHQIMVTKEVHKGDTLVVNTEKEYSFQSDKAYYEGKRQLFIKGTVLKHGTPIYRITDIELFKTIEREILKTEPEINLDAYLEVTIGKPLSLTVVSKEHSITVTGDVVETATNQPVNKKWLEDNLSKTGGTVFGFDQIEISLSENAFVLQKVLKGLRRDALKQMNQVLARKYPGREICKEGFIDVTEPNEDGKQMLTVLLRKRSQFDTIKGYDIDRVILDMNFLTFEDVEVFMKKGYEGDIYLNLPTIIRNKAKGYVLEVLSRVNLDLISGFVVGSYDTWELARVFNKNLILDDSVLIYNNAMIQSIASETEGFCVAKELSLANLKGLNLHRGIVNIYGRQIAMISAQCSYKEAFGCHKESGFYTITDRLGNDMMCFKQCHFCTNFIFNAHKTYLVDKIADYQAVGVNEFRIDFTDETEEEMKAVLGAVGQGLPPESIGLKDFTRGHFKKGVR